MRDQRAQMREDLIGVARRRSGIELDGTDDSENDMTVMPRNSWLEKRGLWERKEEERTTLLTNQNAEDLN